MHGTIIAKQKKAGTRFPRGVRGLAKAMAATACALALGLTGCGDLGGKKKSTPKIVVNPDDIKNPDVKTVVGKLDELLKSNKGKGVVTGFLSGEGKSIAKGLLKQASNAAGERRFLTRTEIPLTGATVLIFNAEKPTTLADTTLKTDSTGTYTAVLPEGKYFGFAVYLDLETFQLVTTQIPNMNPIKDSVVTMDTAVAIEDVTAPTVVGVYDAAAANGDGVFLVGSVPDRNGKINITFSEPMNRESAKGVVLGKVDTASSNTSITLADTLKTVTTSWSGDSKELTLYAAELTAGAQYGIIIPVSLKDLAKNPLEAAYKATFAPVAAKEIEAVAFAVAATFPQDTGSLKPIQNPGVSFNRPVDVFSVVKGAKIEPVVTGFWEVNGARAVFVHKVPFAVGTAYKVTLADSVKDLNGKTLGSAHSFSFTVKDFEGAAKDATGANQAVALAVESMFGAYLSGDLGRFSAAFHANFRMYQGTKIQSKTQFLDMIKADLGERLNMTAGMPAPVFDIDSAACKDNLQRWKVGAQGNASAWLWVESYVNPGSTPRVWGQDKAEIDRTKITWDRTGPRFTYDSKVYGFAPDFSNFGGGVNMDASKDNGRFMADIMAKTSTIILEPVKMERVESFKVDGGMAVSGDTARIAVKMTNTEKLSRGSFDARRGCGGELTYTKYEILKFLLVNDGSRWIVLTIVAPDEEIKVEDFNKTVDVRQNFGGANAAPITLVHPVNGKDNSGAADGSVRFEFNGIRHDSIGGYLVGIAEDPKFTGGRPAFGTLLFVKASNKAGEKESFTLDASAKVSSGNASMVLRRVHDLRLPGWERTLFEFTLSKLVNPDSGFAGVYQWKAIALKDTSAAQFLANGFKMERFLGESDFGPARGYFAVKGYPAANQFAMFENQQFVQPPVGAPGMGGPVGFGDMDQDGVPDFMEQKYGSDMRDRNSYPDFRVDTDNDRMCDFLEQKLDKDGALGLVDKAADAATVKEQIASLARLTPPIVFEDSDGDGFPDDVEQMLGFNPRDPMHNPGTKARASVPVGVFSGKMQVGSATHSVSFKLSQDSAKNLVVAFTAIFGKDTVKDTSRASFNDMMGEVAMALPFPKNGPDSGKALLLRGHYEAIRSLMMGPMDMIMAPASKTTTNFGGGPYVGQFAASSRGDDVSMYLPGSMPGGSTGGYMPPMGGPMPMPGMPSGAMYRMPPPGTSEGAQVVLGSRIVLIDDFGDTLAVIGNLNWRSQPDGSFELFAEERIAIQDGMKRNEVGGRLSVGPDGWVLDGHFMQSKDSAGNHRDIPGQLCAKIAKDGLKPVTGGMGMEGVLKGWIAQDKLGAGFTGPSVPSCYPGMPCMPPTGGTTCPPGTICPPPGGTTCPPGTICPPPGGTYPPTGGTYPPTGGYLPPANSFAVPFMGGSAMVRMKLEGLPEVKASGWFPVSVNGRIYRVDFDSVGLSDAKFPHCGWTVVVPELVPLKEGAGATEISGRSMDSMSIANYESHSLIVLIEDQYVHGSPARIEKARDAQGNILVNVLVAEMRPKAFDYGKTDMQCGPMTGGIYPPGGTTCPAGTICPPPGGTTCPVGTICPPPGGTYPDPDFKPAGRFFIGTLEVVKPVLARTGNSVWFKKDSLSVGEKLTIDPATLFQDLMSKFVYCHPFGQPAMKLVFLGADGGMSLVYSADGLPTVTYPNTGGTLPNPYPTDTTKVTNPAYPTDTTKAGGTYTVLYFQGTLDFVRGELAARGYAGLHIKEGGYLGGRVSLDPATLARDTVKKAVIVKEAGGMGRHFAIMADSLATRLFVRDGALGVFEWMGPIPAPGGTYPTYPTDTTKLTNPTYPTDTTKLTNPTYPTDTTKVTNPYPAPGDTALKALMVKPGESLVFSVMANGMPVSSSFPVMAGTTLQDIAGALTAFLRGPQAGSGMGTTADVVTSMDSQTLAGAITVYGNTMGVMDLRIKNGSSGVAAGPWSLPAGTTRLTFAAIRIALGAI